jgi:hypothetical protein
MWGGSSPRKPKAARSDSLKAVPLFQIGVSSSSIPRSPIRYDASYSGGTILRSAYETMTSENCKTLDAVRVWEDWESPIQVYSLVFIGC